MEVSVYNKRINRVLKSKSLGLTIDENLTCKYQVDNITKKVSSGIAALKRMGDFITTETAIRVYQSLPISSSSLLEELNWQKAILMFNTINKHTPFYLQETFSPRESVYNLRDSYGKLYVAKPRTDYLKRSFSYSGASLWNGLPESLR